MPRREEAPPGERPLSNRSIVVVVTAAWLAPFLCAQDPELARTVEELKKRVEELEDHQAELLESAGGRALVQAYTAKGLDIGGHETSVFASIHGSGGSNTGHLVSLCEFYVKATVSDDWSVFLAPGFYVYNGAFLDDPATGTVGDPGFTSDLSADSHTIISKLQAEYRYSDLLRVRGGVIGTPHGTTSREYFIPSHLYGVGSLHTRLYLENLLFPQQVDGICASGVAATSDWNRVEYDAYAGFADELPDRWMGGARLAYVFGELGLTVSAEGGLGTRPGRSGADLLTNVAYLESPFPSNFNTQRDYRFGGATAELRSGPLVNKTEAYYSAENGYGDQKAFSTEWTWFVHEKLGLSYRFDYYDRGSDEFVTGISPTITTALAPTGHATEHAFALVYDPLSTVRFRLDYHHLLLPNSSEAVDFVNFGWSVSF